MKLSISMAAHRGKVRQKNEDNLYVNGLILEQQNNGISPWEIQLNTEKPCLMGVFDGMGGYAAGERASFLAASTAMEIAGAYSDELSGDALMLRICQLANDRVCEEMQKGDYYRIGTTASMLHLHENRYTVCNVGDSPVFLYRDGALRLISKEHTEKANYEKITGNKAPPNKKFRLTQNIGIFTSEMLIEPYCASDDIHSGDCFLLCSDGLTDMVSSEKITEILACNLTMRQKAETLLHTALDNGGKDNITIVLISAEEDARILPISKVLPLALSSAAFLLALIAVVVLCFTGRQSDFTAPTETTSISEDASNSTQSSDVETTEGVQSDDTETEATETEATEAEATETEATETEATETEATEAEATEAEAAEVEATETTPSEDSSVSA